MERAYPAVAIEIQQALGAQGFAFDMNVACSSATFGIQAAADMVRSGSVRRAIVVNPEICSGHLEWRDRDCHFIFWRRGHRHGDRTHRRRQKVTTSRSSQPAAPHSSPNNIRNNNGFLRRSRPDGVADRRDMQFMQNGRKVFKEVVPMVFRSHARAHCRRGRQHRCPTPPLAASSQQVDETISSAKKVLGRTPDAGEQPNILQDYANTSSAGSIIAFSKYSDDLAPGDYGVICSFGAGYSVGSVLLRRH